MAIYTSKEALKNRKDAIIYENSSEDITPTLHAQLLDDFIDSLRLEVDGLPTDWVSTIVALRALTDHDDGSDIGVYEVQSVYAYDEIETTVDDGYNYIQPGDVTGNGRWVRQKTFIATPIPIAHADLRILKIAGTMVAGQVYYISDFILKHQIPETTDINTGVVEGLYVTAISGGELNPVAKSSDYPDDLIFYDIDNILCEDSVTARKGYINRRINTVLNIDLPADFINYKVRRWEVKSTRTFIAAQSYNIGELFKHATTDVLYVSLRTGTIADFDDAIDNGSVVQYYDNSVDYVGFNTSNADNSVGVITMNLDVDITTYNDVYIFSDALTNDYANYKNIRISNAVDGIFNCNFYDGISSYKSDIYIDVVDSCTLKGAAYFYLGYIANSVILETIRLSSTYINKGLFSDDRGRSNIKINYFSGGSTIAGATSSIDIMSLGVSVLNNVSSLFANNVSSSMLHNIENLKGVIISNFKSLINSVVSAENSKKNIVYNVSDSVGLDLWDTTFIDTTGFYGNFTKTIEERFDGTPILSYLDNLNGTVLIDPTV